MFERKSGAAARPSEILQSKEGKLPSVDLQELWFSTIKHVWTSLVVVPADESCSAGRIAESLAEMATLHLGKPMTSLITTGLDLARASDLMTSLQVRDAVYDPEVPKGGSPAPWLGRNVVIAIDPLSANPSGIAVAFAADAALLCVKLGRTKMKVAQRTIELIGRERFIGCVLER